MVYKCKNCGETFPYQPVFCNECGVEFNITTFEIVKQKICPNCGKDWDGIECNYCGMDTSFDPNWD